MSIYIALLRGINVSGQKSVKMDRLRQLFEGLGYTGVTTYIQSGNVVFRAGELPANGLEQAATRMDASGWEERDMAGTSLASGQEQPGMADSTEVSAQEQQRAIRRTKARSSEQLEAVLHEALLAQLGYDIPVIVRTPAELKGIVAGLPWPLPQKGDAPEPQVYVTLLAQPPSEAGLAKLQGVQSGEDVYVVDGQTVYVLVRGRYGDTKLSNQTIEKKLGVSATTRNWETMNRLVLLAEAAE